MASGPQRSLTAIRTDETLHRAGIPKAAFAFILGVPIGSLKAAMAGRIFVGSELEAHYLSIACRCAAYMDALGVLTFRNWSALKKLIESHRTPDEVRVAITSVFGDCE
jgi:hypothetical protein